MTWDDWKAAMRCSLQAASIARQYHDQLATGRPVTDDDMRTFVEVAGKLDDAWQDTLPYVSRGG